MPSTNSVITTTPEVNPSESVKPIGTLPGWIFSNFDAGLGRIANATIEMAEKGSKKCAKYVPSFLTVSANFIPKMVFMRFAYSISEFTEKWGKKTPITICTPVEYVGASLIKLARKIWPEAYKVLTLIESINDFSETVSDLAEKHLTLKSTANINKKEIVEKATCIYESAIMDYLRKQQLPGMVENTLKGSAHHTIVWLERSTIVYCIPFFGSATWYISSWIPVLPTLVYFTVFSSVPWTYLLQSKIPDMLSESKNININPELPDMNKIVQAVANSLTETLKDQTKSPKEFLNKLSAIDLNIHVEKKLKKNPFKVIPTETAPVEPEKKTTEKEGKKEKKDVKIEEEEHRRVTSDDEGKLTNPKEIKKLKAANEDLEKKLKKVETEYKSLKNEKNEKKENIKALEKKIKELTHNYSDLETKHEEALKLNGSLLDSLKANPVVKQTLKKTPLIPKATEVHSDSEDEERVVELTEETIEKEDESNPISLSQATTDEATSKKSKKTSASTSEPPTDKKSIDVQPPEKVASTWFKFGLGSKSTPETPKSSAKQKKKSSDSDE